MRLVKETRLRQSGPQLLGLIPAYPGAKHVPGNV
jgi:hypothetical protein